MNDNRQKRLSEALRANLKRRKQQAKGRADQASGNSDAGPGAQPEEDTDTAAPVRNEDKRG